MTDPWYLDGLELYYTAPNGLESYLIGDKDNERDNLFEQR